MRTTLVVLNILPDDANEVLAGGGGESSDGGGSGSGRNGSNDGE